MKQRIYLFAFLFLAIGFTSCKDDDNDPDPLPEVVGKWELDYGILSELRNPPSGGLQNGDKIDPNAELVWEYAFPLFTLHVLNENNRFVNIGKQLGTAGTLPGSWTYASPSLTLNYDESNFTDEVYTYGREDGLEQLSISESLVDTAGVAVGKVLWVYHK